MIQYELHGTCRRLAEVPDGAHVQSINGRPVMGRCEACGKWLFTDSKYGWDDEGTYWCSDEKGCLRRMRPFRGNNGGKQ